MSSHDGDSVAGHGRYRSIFLSRQWQHVRYLGWRECPGQPGIRVIERGFGPITRRLLLLDRSDYDRDALAAALGADRSPLRETFVHDFTGADAVRAHLSARGYAELGASRRLLNIATFVIDLGRSEAELKAALTSDARRKLRRAVESGMSFDAHAGSPEEIEAFHRANAVLATARRFQPVARDLTSRMLSEGAARLFTVRLDGAPIAFLLIYLAEDSAIFLHGASTVKDEGSGYLLQWGAILALQAAGVRWYDMGGLPAIDSANGIYRFKKAFGGELVRLGCEYGRVGSVARAARAALLAVRRG